MYDLQPISSLPECTNYFLSDDDITRGNRDTSFKSARGALQRLASVRWWCIFGEIQSLLREASALSDLTVDEKKKYEICVTHDEVNRGILNNLNVNRQSFCFFRTIDYVDD